jgi:hypothetical protein
LKAVLPRRNLFTLSRDPVTLCAFFDLGDLWQDETKAVLLRRKFVMKPSQTSGVQVKSPVRP